MLTVKRLIFKCLEVALGPQPYFYIQTRDPLFINFKLSQVEAAQLQQTLAEGFLLEKIRFASNDAEPSYLLSYNFYRLSYPNPKLKHISKVRCELNTFVKNSSGQIGVYVLSPSPWVSQDKNNTWLGVISDLAERVVVKLYGCGALVQMHYELTDNSLCVQLDTGGHVIDFDKAIVPERSSSLVRLSEDYYRCNDICFFNHGKTADFVYADSAFATLRLHKADAEWPVVSTPFFSRAPDSVYFTSLEIPYMVRALTKVVGPIR